MAKTAEQHFEVVRERAISKILWGERDTDVFRFLRDEGVDDSEIEEILNDGFSHRAAVIRKRSLGKVVLGIVGVVLGGAGGVISLLHFNPGGILCGFALFFCFTWVHMS